MKKIVNNGSFAKVFTGHPVFSSKATTGQKNGFITLCYFAHPKGRKRSTTVKETTLAQIAGTTDKTIRRQLEGLADLGFISIERFPGRKVSRYTITHPDPWGQYALLNADELKAKGIAGLVYMAFKAVADSDTGEAYLSNDKGAAMVGVKTPNFIRGKNQLIESGYMESTGESIGGKPVYFLNQEGGCQNDRSRGINMTGQTEYMRYQNDRSKGIKTSGQGVSKRPVYNKEPIKEPNKEPIKEPNKEPKGGFEKKVEDIESELEEYYNSQIEVEQQNDFEENYPVENFFYKYPHLVGIPADWVFNLIWIEENSELWRSQYPTPDHFPNFLFPADWNSLHDDETDPGESWMLFDAMEIQQIEIEKWMDAEIQFEIEASNYEPMGSY